MFLRTQTSKSIEASSVQIEKLKEAIKMFADGYLFYCSVNGVWLTKKVPIEYLTKQ